MAVNLPSFSMETVSDKLHPPGHEKLSTAANGSLPLSQTDTQSEEVLDRPERVGRRGRLAGPLSPRFICLVSVVQLVREGRI